MQSVTITNTTNTERAEKIKEIFQGKTYMNFNVGICPVGGSFDVIVETQYETTQEEFTAFVIDFMADNLAYDPNQPGAAPAALKGAPMTSAKYETIWIVWANGKNWEFRSHAAAKYWAYEQNGSAPRKIKRRIIN